MQNFLSDPLNVQQYHNEYLKIMNYYQNTKRPSCFVRYFNIDVARSTYEEGLNSSYDTYQFSKIIFNLYDLTPTNYSLPVINTTTAVPDLAGQMYDGLETIVTYTIDRPRIGDLVTFYDPIRSEEIFRVTSVRTQVNAVHSETSLNWFELQLEYAPVKDITKLHIDKQFVYDLTTEKYILKSDYEKYISQLQNLKNELEKIFPFYHQRHDFYCVEDFRYIPIETNELIIFIKDDFNYKYRDLFNQIKKPYGYLDRFKEMTYDNIDSLPFQNSKNHFKLFDRKENQIKNYYFDRELPFSNDIDILLNISFNIFEAYNKS